MRQTIKYKSTTIFLIFTLFLLTTGLNAQTGIVNISATNKPIKEVLAELQHQSDFRILYNDEIVPDHLLITVAMDGKPIQEVLSAMLHNSGLTYVMQSDELIIITKSKYIDGKQEIFGTITDENNNPIPFANIVLFEAGDTTQLSYGVVSDYDGYYKLPDVKPGKYRLRISFIGYKTDYADFSVPATNQRPIVRDFKLERDAQLLQELTIEGEHPAMKIEHDKIVYYIPSLLKNKAATNAYEAIKEIPGVMEMNGVLSIIGTTSMTVLLNGQKSSLPYEQLIELLRGIPISQVETIEIMYSTPPQYNIRGAAINVILKQTGSDNVEQHGWQGETTVDLIQREHTGGNGRVNLIYNGKRTSFDASYAFKTGKLFNSEELTADHIMQDQVYNIEQHSEGITKVNSHNIRMALNHNQKNNNKVNIAYTGIFNKGITNRIAKTNIAGEIIDTKSNTDGPSYTHNIKADYKTNFGLNIGADYTSFYNWTEHLLEHTRASTSEVSELLTYDASQHIDRVIIYASQSHQLPANWNIDYGLNYSGVYVSNRSDAIRDGVEDEETSFNTGQKEHIWNIYAGFSKPFTDKLSTQASISMEYYHTKEISNGIESVLWNNVDWFPTINLSYTHSPKHIFQFSISSDKRYPSYWNMSPNKLYFSAYGVIYGNPHLRPQMDYNIGLTYIYQHKYIIRPFINYTPDYFAQLPYQSHDQLHQIFLEQNYNYRQNIGISTVIPFNIGSRISSRIIANGVYQREKDDEFFDISFDRKSLVGIFQMKNDIVFSTKPNLKMNISGYLSTPGVTQGIYDLGISGDLSGAFTWTSDNNRTRLVLKAEDIFNTRIPVATIDYKGQKSSLKAFQDTRIFSLSFIYRFGGYKETKHETVDTSRFGGL